MELGCQVNGERWYGPATARASQLNSTPQIIMAYLLRAKLWVRHYGVFKDGETLIMPLRCLWGWWAGGAERTRVIRKPRKSFQMTILEVWWWVNEEPSRKSVYHKGNWIEEICNIGDLEGWWGNSETSNKRQLLPPWSWRVKGEERCWWSQWRLQPWKGQDFESWGRYTRRTVRNTLDSSSLPSANLPLVSCRRKPGGMDPAKHCLQGSTSLWCATEQGNAEEGSWGKEPQGTQRCTVMDKYGMMEIQSQRSWTKWEKGFQDSRLWRAFCPLWHQLRNISYTVRKSEVPITFFQRRDTDGQKAYEKMLNITNYKGNANQN